MAKRRAHRTYRVRLAIDTATMAVFDLSRLRHRLADPIDWWTSAGDVLADLNAGNVLPINVLSDGVYDVYIHLDDDRPGPDAGAGLGPGWSGVTAGRCSSARQGHHRRRAGAGSFARRGVGTLPGRHLPGVGRR